MLRTLCILIILTLFWSGCKHDPPIPKPAIYNTTTNTHASVTTKLVFILVDGPRWTETWGDSTHQYQPYLNDSLQQLGCLFTNFYNNGFTYTVPGHTALLTGHYQNIANDGSEYPMYPSLGQLFLQKKNKSANYSWLITSKDKLQVLSSCNNTAWQNKYTPDTDCGVAGLGSGYRDDSTTFAHAIKTLQNQQPDFLFIQFKEPDASGHANNWQGYINGIKQGDKYAWMIWKELQSLSSYKDNTIFVITNDHGRHTNGVLDEFISHGDTCIGCRHINLFMAGPGIKKGSIISANYEQIDLHKTLCSLFDLDAEFSDGKIIQEIR